MKYTMHDLITLHLHDNKGTWIPSYSLSKLNTKRGWLGSSSERRARELAEKGYHIFKGEKYFIEKKIEGKYAYYRCTGTAPLISHPSQTISLFA